MKSYIAAAFALQLLCCPAQAQLYPIPDNMPTASRDHLIYMYEQSERASENYEHWMQQQNDQWQREQYGEPRRPGYPNER